MNDDDLLAALGEAVRARQAVPARFVEIAKAAYTWHDVDAELAALSYDSATSPVPTGTRSDPGELRALTFVASNLTIELEATSDALLGQLVPPQPGSVSLQTRSGATATVDADDVGWFAIRPLPAGPFRLRVSPVDGDVVITEWIVL